MSDSSELAQPQLYAWALVFEDECSLDPFVDLPRTVCIAEKEPKSPVLVRTLVTASCVIVARDKSLNLLAGDLPLAIPRAAPGTEGKRNKKLDDPQYNETIPFRACLKLGKVWFPGDEATDRLIAIELPSDEFRADMNDDYLLHLDEGWLQGNARQAIQKVYPPQHSILQIPFRTGPKRIPEHVYFQSHIILYKRNNDGWQPYIDTSDISDFDAYNPEQPVKIRFREHDVHCCPIKIPAKTRCVGALVLNNVGKVVGITYAVDSEVSMSAGTVVLRILPIASLFCECTGGFVSRLKEKFRTNKATLGVRLRRVQPCSSDEDWLDSDTETVHIKVPI